MCIIYNPQLAEKTQMSSRNEMWTSRAIRTVRITTYYPISVGLKNGNMLVHKTMLRAFHGSCYSNVSVWLANRIKVHGLYQFNAISIYHPIQLHISTMHMPYLTSGLGHINHLVSMDEFMLPLPCYYILYIQLILYVIYFMFRMLLKKELHSIA